jgi:hypothetical protein
VTKHLRNFFSLLLVLLLLLQLLTLGAGAADGVEASGKCGEAVTWQLTTDGTLTIQGSGAMRDYGTATSPWDSDRVLSLVVEEGVTTIGESAFLRCEKMVSATLPQSLTSIGASAFQECKQLQQANIPDGVTEIGEAAFSGCRKLTSPTLPSGLTVIEPHVFEGCFELLQIVIPDGVTTIGDSAFLMSGLESVTIPDSVTSIGQEAFSSTALSSVTIPDSVTSIGAYLFQNCGGLLRVTLSKNITVIPMGCFEGCIGLTEVTIPSGVTTIGDGAFNVCSSLTSLTIPASVTSIGSDAYGYFYTFGYNDDDDYVYTWSQVPGATIYGVSGSAAQTYAEQNDIAFSSLAALPEDPSTQSPDPSPDPSESPQVTPAPEPTESPDPSSPDDLAHPPALTYPTQPKDETPEPTTVSFADVEPGSYYEEAVQWALTGGITTGTSDTTFSPEGGCTRGQIVTFLWRANGAPEPTTTVNPFADLSPDDYYYQAVLWAYETGITTGTSETAFSPDLVCTRAQAVTFLWRSQGAPEGSASATFIDVEPGSYYETAVSWAYTSGITTGTSETTFSPEGSCIRAQIVTFLWRTMTAAENIVEE